MPRADSPKDASARRRSGRIPKPPPTRRPATLSSSHPSKDPTNSTSYSVAQAAARDKDRDPNTGGPNETILWKHPAELEFIYPDDYSQSDIISFLIQNAFSIPPPPPTTGKSGSAAPSTPGAPTTPGGSSDAPSSMEDFTVITAVDGTPTILPLGYRIPLMFAAKYLWDSVRLVLTSVDPPPETEWEAYKYDILNLSRLCSAFLAEARNAMKARRGKGMSKRWRSQMFDRVLTRYHWGWLVNREEYIRAFWNEFREDEYEKDVLRRDWRERALKGHNGFHLTEEEINEGITAEKFQSGLSLVNGRYIWDVEATSNDTNGNANGHDSGADASAFDASGDHPRRRHGLSSPMRNIKKELIEPSSPFGGMRRADFSHSISPLSPNVSEDEAAGGVGKDATEEEDEDIASSNDESRRRQEGKKGKKKAKELDRQGYSYPRHARRGRVRTARRGLNFVRGSTGSGRRGWGRWGRSDSSEQESSEDESSGSGSDISSASRRKTTPSTSTSSASPSARGATGVKAPSEANMAKEREKKEKQETEKEEREKEEKEKEAMGKEEKEKEEREEEEREKEEREKEEREKEEKEKEKREKKEQENERQESGNAERAAIVNGSGVEAMVVDVPARPPPAAQTPTSPIPASSATLTRAPTPTSAEVPIVAPTLTASVPTPASLAASTPTPAGEEGHSLKRRRESSTSVDRPAKRPERDSFPPISPPPTMPHRDPEGAAVMAALTAVADAINARNANGASGVPMVTNSSPIVASALAVMHGAVLSSSTQKTDTPGVPPTARALAEAVISIVKGPNGSTFLANVTPAAATPASKALSPILGAKAASPVLMDGIPAASAANGSLTNGSAKGATDTVAKTTPQSLTPILTNASTPALAIPNTALPKSIQGGTPAIQRINSNDRPNSSVNGQGSMSPSEFGSFPPRAKGKASFFGLAGEKSASEVKADVADIGAGVSSGVTGESGGMTGVEGGASGSQREGDMEEVHGVGVGEEFEHQPTHESRIRSQSPIHSPNSRARDDNSPFEEIGRLLSSSDDDQETCDLLVNGGVDVDMNDATGSGEEKKVVEQPVVLQHEASIVPPEEMLPPPAQLSVQKQTQHYHPPQNQHSAQPQVQQSQQPLSDLLLGGSVKGRDDMLQKVVSVVPGMLASLQALLEAATDGGISRGVSTGIGVCAGGSGEGGNMKGKEKEVQSVGRVDRGVMVNSAFPGPSSFDPQRSSLNDVARLARNGQIDPLLVSMLLERIDSLELEMLNEREERRSMQADIGDLQANEEDLRQQNILLHQQNANLRQHTTELRQQNAGLRQEVSSLKHDIGDLRRQMMSAPTMTPTSSVAVAGGHATNHNHNHDHVPTRPSSSASNAVRASGIPLSSLLDVEQLRASNNNTTAAPLVHLLALDLESIRSHAGPVAKDLPSPAPKDDAPATPAPSEGNPYVRRSMSQSDLIEEGLPLPIKSQRKHHMMTFPRSPMSMEE